MAISYSMEWLMGGMQWEPMPLTSVRKELIWWASQSGSVYQRENGQGQHPPVNVSGKDGGGIKSYPAYGSTVKPV